MAKTTAQTATIGLRAKTARAIAVVLAGPANSPRVIKRTELRLADMSMPETSQPYHEVMELPWERAKIEVRKTAARIEKLAAKELARLVKEVEAAGFKVRGVGIVGAGNRNLEKIGSTHIRAHSAEGVLFRQVLESAATANKLRSRSLDEKTLDEIASSELNRPIEQIKAQLAEMGRAAGSPWRADEKAAATAALLAAARH